ncbi:MAG: hypothetical protein IAI49_06980, partial [Candidatus Eremiobacteraeota bacterium]|nr:hypothetical protein [Candidatus Eremiobacteraeota bacterium]
MLDRHDFLGFAGGMLLATLKPARGHRARPHPLRPVTTGTAYVVCSESNAVAVVDLATSRIVQYLTVGLSPSHIVLDSRRRRAYVSNFAANTISVIDLTRLEVTGEFDARTGPGALALDDGGNLLYFASVAEGTVSALDTASGGVAGSAIVGKRPIEMALDFRTGALYVVDEGVGTLSYVETRGRKLIATPLRADPSASNIALSRDGVTGYVGNAAAGTLSLLDLGARRISSTIDGLRSPQSIAVTNDPTRIYV